MKRVLAACLVLCLATQAQASIRITEWMYSGDDGEFIEVCNVGAVPVNMAGWSYSDSARTPGAISLSAFGTLNPGGCGIISEPSAIQFVQNWDLLNHTVVPIIGGNTANLGRQDEINIYDDGNSLVDRLTYGDNLPQYAGSIRTQNASGWVNFAGLGANDVFAWTLSTPMDLQGSWVGVNGNVGSPGTHVIPEPASIGLLGLGIFGLIRRRR